MSFELPNLFYFSILFVKKKKSTVSFQFSLKLCPRWHSLPLQTPMSVLHFQKEKKLLSSEGIRPQLSEDVAIATAGEAKPLWELLCSPGLFLSQNKEAGIRATPLLMP